MKILCLDHNRPLRPRTYKEEEEELYMKGIVYINVQSYYASPKCTGLSVLYVAA
jgi:hypothetical protein